MTITHAAANFPIAFKVTLGRFHESCTEIGPVQSDAMSIDWPCGNDCEGMEVVPIEDAVGLMQARGE